MLKIVDTHPVVQPCSVASCAHLDCLYVSPLFTFWNVDKTWLQIDCVFIDKWYVIYVSSLLASSHCYIRGCGSWLVAGLLPVQQPHLLSLNRHRFFPPLDTSVWEFSAVSSIIFWKFLLIVCAWRSWYTATFFCCFQSNIDDYVILFFFIFSSVHTNCTMSREPFVACHVTCKWEKAFLLWFCKILDFQIARKKHWWFCIWRIFNFQFQSAQFRG